MGRGYVLLLRTCKLAPPGAPTELVWAGLVESDVRHPLADWLPGRAEWRARGSQLFPAQSIRIKACARAQADRFSARLRIAGRFFPRHCCSAQLLLHQQLPPAGSSGP